MKKQCWIVILIAAATQVLALPLDLYNDTLYYGAGGISATYNWNNDETWLHWNISPEEDGSWSYDYTFHVSGADLSHIIIELSDGAVEEDFWDWEYEGSDVGEDSPEFGTYSPSDPGDSNPFLPGSIFGFKLDPESSVPVFGFSFVTWRAPVWGDFYAKDGRQGTGPNRIETVAFNSGFLLTDANDGLHIARPNGRTVPDGSLAVTLLGFSFLGIEWLRRKLNGGAKG